MDRTDPPHVADERTLLVAFLDYQRATIARKALGVPDHMLSWSPVGTGTSLGGLLTHLTQVANWWFTAHVGRGEVAYPFDEADPDSDFRVPPGATAESLVEAYAAECARSNAAIAAADLDGETDPAGERPGRSVRWVLLHMIEETARHNGHLDAVRELVDGIVGE